MIELYFKVGTTLLNSEFFFTVKKLDFIRPVDKKNHPQNNGLKASQTRKTKTNVTCKIY